MFGKLLRNTELNKAQYPVQTLTQKLEMARQRITCTFKFPNFLSSQKLSD